jgi:phosphatidylglycerol:prolipoprotein diacylglycerol transferase
MTPLIHPQWSPVALQIGPFPIHWYGLMYVVGFLLFNFLAQKRLARYSLTEEQLEDFFIYAVLGVILGGRVGYVLFYNLEYYLAHPENILKFWQGGMSFHGGFLGVTGAIFLFSRKVKQSFLQFADFIAPCVPLGLACGRFGNFMNQELYGRITPTVEWYSMVFPVTQDNLPRHPSQLYEMVLEGFVLFTILWIFTKWREKQELTMKFDSSNNSINDSVNISSASSCRYLVGVGQTSSLFLLGYGFFRFLVEYVREPDLMLGIRALGMTRGQWLCVPMILLGLFVFIMTRNNHIEQKL